MQELLGALLKYSRVTTQASPFTVIDLNGVVRDTVSDLELAIRRTGGRIEVGPLPELEADEPQMRQLFQNLLGNGLKYRHEDRKPLIKVHAGTEGGICRIFVEDNGIGFDEKYLDKIFLPFHRLHGHNARYEGSGMGLAICKKIVERHGGSITARSTPGEGSTFVVELPMKK